MLLSIQTGNSCSVDRDSCSDIPQQLGLDFFTSTEEDAVEY